MGGGSASNALDAQLHDGAQRNAELGVAQAREAAEAAGAAANTRRVNEEVQAAAIMAAQPSGAGAGSNELAARQTDGAERIAREDDARRLGNAQLEAARAQPHARARRRWTSPGAGQVDPGV